MIEDLVALVPAYFFEIQLPLYYVRGRKLEKRHLLPDFSFFYGTRSFADVRMGWNEEGVLFGIEVDGAFNQPEFPHIERGDAVEFFLDTRDVKTRGYNTRFCHHFFFLPQAMDQGEGRVVQAGELTRFRTEDAHPLCEASYLEVKSEKQRMEIFIPAGSLWGYDAQGFDRLGFTYRLTKRGGVRQYFSVSDHDFSFEQQPSFWASLKMVK